MSFTTGIFVFLCISLIAGNHAASGEKGQDLFDAFESTIDNIVKDRIARAINVMQNEMNSLKLGLQLVQEKSAKLESELDELRRLNNEQANENEEDMEILGISTHKIKAIQKHQNRINRKKVETSKNISGASETVETLRPSGNLMPAKEAAESVAFSAYLSHTDGPLTNQPVIFDRVILNEGRGYNPNTGIFTVPVSGIYMFTFTLDTTVASFYGLMVDNQNVVDAFANRHFNSPTEQGAQTMGGNSCIVRVIKGQEVLVQEYGFPNGAVSSSYEYRLTTFSGFLIK